MNDVQNLYNPGQDPVNDHRSKSCDDPPFLVLYQNKIYHDGIAGALAVINASYPHRFMKYVSVCKCFTHRVINKISVNLKSTVYRELKHTNFVICHGQLRYFFFQISNGKLQGVAKKPEVYPGFAAGGALVKR